MNWKALAKALGVLAGVCLFMAMFVPLFVGPGWLNWAALGVYEFIIVSILVYMMYRSFDYTDRIRRAEHGGLNDGKSGGDQNHGKDTKEV